jgi:16S rRNA (cytosine1402-N4)-methyltransferase
MQPRQGGRYIDATVGSGGHAAGLLEASRPDGLLLGLDLDPQAIALAHNRLEEFGRRVILVPESYLQLEQRMSDLGWDTADGILFDLGLSSMQLDQPARGFSFQEDGPLDMRFNPESGRPASDLVNELPGDELGDLIFQYGEERNARRIARAILRARPIHTTHELARVVARAVGGRRGRRTHPATRTFQALRIAVNDELATLEAALPLAVQSLAQGGRLAVIAFHSLEDRLVKRYFQTESRDCICPPEMPACTCGHRASIKIVTRKPIRPAAEEIETNPRSRSARLRVAEKLFLQEAG